MDIFASVSPIETLLAFIIYIGSFAAIPLLAKAFAGALNRLTGLVGDKTKGIFDRPRKAMEKQAEDLKARQALRKATRKGLRGQLRQSLPSPFQRISPKRFLRGGSWRNSAVGKRRAKSGQAGFGQYLQGRRDDRRQIADLAHESEVAEPYQKLAEQSEAVLAGKDFNHWQSVAEDKSEALHRRQVAIVHLAKAGAVGHLREIIDNAVATPAKDDKTLHLALNNAVKTGVFYKEAVTKKAPDLATISFETQDAQGKPRIKVKAISDEARQKTVGNIAVKDSTDMDISTWRTSFGLKPKSIRGSEVIKLTDSNPAVTKLRQSMLNKVKNLMAEDNKVGESAMTVNQRALFEKVLAQEKEDSKKTP